MVLDRAQVPIKIFDFDPLLHHRQHQPHEHQPHRPHPHNLVGKEGCKKGVCTIHMNDDMTAAFPNLGIQCVKKKDIDESLSLRQQIRVDPFQSRC